MINPEYWFFKLWLWSESGGQNQGLNRQCWVGFLIGRRREKHDDDYRFEGLTKR